MSPPLLVDNWIDILLSCEIAEIIWFVFLIKFCPYPLPSNALPTLLPKLNLTLSNWLIFYLTLRLNFFELESLGSNTATDFTCFTFSSTVHPNCIGCTPGSTVHIVHTHAIVNKAFARTRKLRQKTTIQCWLECQPSVTFFMYYLPSLILTNPPSWHIHTKPVQPDTYILSILFAYYRNNWSTSEAHLEHTGRCFNILKTFAWPPLTPHDNLWTPNAAEVDKSN